MTCNLEFPPTFGTLPWLDRHTLNDPSAVIAKSELCEVYNQFLRRERRPAMTSNAYGRALKRLRPDIGEAQRSIRGQVVWAWLGISLAVSAILESN